MAAIRLRTLGHTELEHPDGSSILSVLTQPKRLALLVYLAVEARDGFVRRDRLTALFWPEHGHQRARSNLRKALSLLRRSLGPQVIITRGDEEVGITAEALWCDVPALHQAAAAGDTASVERLARGTFLDGFAYRGAPAEWDAWVEAQRSAAEVLFRSREPDISPSPLVRPREPRRPSPRVRAAWTATAAAVLGGIWIAIGVGHGVLPGPLEFTIPLPTTGTLASGQWMDLSPDGEEVVFIGRRANGEPLQLRVRSSAEPTAVPGSEGARLPFFSHDGEWVGFVRGERLMKVPVSGGSAATIVDDPAILSLNGATWGPEGSIVGWISRSPLARFNANPASQGGIEFLTTLAEGDLSHRLPSFIPGKNAVLFDVRPQEGPPTLAVLDLESGAVTRLGLEGSTPKYAPSGHIFYADREGAILAAPFDTDRLRVTGPPEFTGRTANMRPTGADFDVAGDGTMAAISPYVLPRRLVRVDRSGAETPLTREWRAYQEPRIAPDGRRVVMSVLDGPLRSIWIQDLADGREEQLTTEFSRRPFWHPLDDAVGFSGPAPGIAGWTGFLIAVGGSRAPVRLYESSTILGWSADGRWRLRARGYAGRASAENVATGAVMDLAEGATNPSFSPDGRWLLFDLATAGRTDVYAQRFPELTPTHRVSEAGGSAGVWSPRGDEIYYVADGRLVAAGVTTDPAFTVRSRSVLFEFPYLQGTGRQYDVFPDGTGFLAIRQGDPEVDIVVSRGWVDAWVEGLSR